MSTRCPFATWRPITTNYAQGGRRTIRGFVPHVQVGTGSLHGFFNTPKPKGQRASADFWISKTGTLEQYVDLADMSFAQGSKEHNGNPYFVSCEFEGYPYEAMAPAQLDVGGRLIAWVQTDVARWPLVVNTDPDSSGVTPHHVFGGGHTCPGPGPREGQYPDLVLAALRHLDDHQPEDDMPPAPAIARLADGNVVTVVRGDDHKTFFYSDHPGGYSPIPGAWVSGPAVEANGLEVIVRGVGTDGQLYETRLVGGAWSTPQPLGGKAG